MFEFLDTPKHNVFDDDLVQRLAPRCCRHFQSKSARLLLSALLDALLAGVQWSLAFGFIGHVFPRFGV